MDSAFEMMILRDLLPCRSATCLTIIALKDEGKGLRVERRSADEASMMLSNLKLREPLVGACG